MHQAHGLNRGLGEALARAAIAICLVTALAACGATKTAAPEGSTIVTRASTSTTGVAITDVFPGGVLHARMNDAGLIAYSTGSTGYVYDTNTKTLTDLNDVAPCPPTSGNHNYEVRKVAQTGLVLFVCYAADGRILSYVWDAVARTAPIELPGVRTRAFDMNDAGTVVGNAIFDFGTPNNRQRGFVWHMGDAHMIEILPMTANGLGITSAYQVNDAGQVLASGPTEESIPGLGAERYYIVDATGGVTVLTGFEAGGGGDFDQAQINDLGDVVGMNFVRNVSPQQTRVFHRAADGTMTDVGLGVVRGFNASSTVVFTDFTRNFIWNPVTQVVTEIVIPGATYADVAAMNDAGQVLLTVVLDGDVRALVWEPTAGEFVELGLPADVADASRSEARAMNDAGQVVGQFMTHPAFHGLVWNLRSDPGIDPPTFDSPTADAGGPYTVIAGNAVTLDGTGSSDPDGAALTYEWDLDFDGVTFVPSETGATVTLETTAGDAGRVFTVALRVASDAGVSDVATASVMVISPLAAVLGLREAVRDLGLTGVLEPGQTTGLIRTLDTVRRSLRRGLVAPACSQLQDFIDGVDDLVADGALPAEDGDALLVDAAAVRSAIGCTTAEGL